MSEEYFDFEESTISQIDIIFYAKQLVAEVIEMITAEYGSVEEYVKDFVSRNSNMENTYQLFERLASCKRLEQLFLCQRFGLIDGRPKTLDEIAKMFGITRDRARQIERKCLRPGCRLKRRKRLIDFLEN